MTFSDPKSCPPIFHTGVVLSCEKTSYFSVHTGLQINFTSFWPSHEHLPVLVSDWWCLYSFQNWVLNHSTNPRYRSV